MYQLVLASQSPRRKELLQWTYLPFQVIPSKAKEVSSLEDPQDYVQELAQIKAKDIAQKVKNSFVIGADTIVYFDGKILEKPKDTNEARKMLQLLSGKTHQVFTGVCLAWEDKELIFVEESRVSFDYIAPDLLELYLATGEPLDKAGSYGIQGAALGFIKGIEGSYSNVVGLPVDRVLSKIKEGLHAQEDQEGLWRKKFITP